MSESTVIIELTAECGHLRAELARMEGLLLTLAGEWADGVLECEQLKRENIALHGQVDP